MVTALGMAMSAHADLVVPQGATVDLGGGLADLGCTDVTINGTLIVGGTLANVRNFTIGATGAVVTAAAAFQVGGNWSNAGSFGGGSSDVRFADVCGQPSGAISGNTTFQNVRFETATGKNFVFQVGTTQTISGLLRIAGTAAQPIQFLSGAPGTVSSINLLGSGTQQIQNVGVTDVWATGQWLAPNGTNQGGGGNASRWFGTPNTNTAEPIPTLADHLLVAMAALMAASGALFLRRRPLRRRT